MIKTPKFWLKKNVISLLLWPLSLIYAVGFCAARFFKKKNAIAKPIICVGNLTVGGSGKTPTAISIGKILREKGINFAYLSRGYQGKEKDFCEVRFSSSKAADIGDEPLLLSEIAPTFVTKNRFEGAKKLEQKSELQAIIFDDGMQNNSVKKDLLILVIDGKIKFGNGFLFPAGPLRQSVSSGLKAADLIVVAGEIDEELQQILSQEIAQNKVVKTKIVSNNLEEFRGQKLLAFCGLAYPEKFFSYLRNSGLNVEETEIFADHYFYKNSDLESLTKKAENLGARLITTKKDWVKFDENYRKKIDFLDIEFVFENQEILTQKIEKILNKR